MAVEEEELLRAALGTGSAEPKVRGGWLRGSLVLPVPPTAARTETWRNLLLPARGGSAQECGLCSTFTPQDLGLLCCCKKEPYEKVGNLKRWEEVGCVRNCW